MLAILLQNEGEDNSTRLFLTTALCALLLLVSRAHSPICAFPCCAVLATWLLDQGASVKGNNVAGWDCFSEAVSLGFADLGVCVCVCVCVAVSACLSVCLSACVYLPH